MHDSTGFWCYFFTNHRRFSVCFALDILWVLQSVSISCLYMPTRITNKTWSTLHFRWVMSQWFQHNNFFFILLTFFPTKSKVDMLSILSVNLVSFGPERQFYAIYPMIGLRKNLFARVVYIVCRCDLLPLLFQKRKTIFQQSFCNNWWMTAIMKQ